MEWTNKYVGIDFVDKGRDLSGADCWGLGKLILEKEKNLIVPSYLDYIDTEDIKNINQLISQHSVVDWIKVEEEKEFDFVLMRMRGFPAHVGVVVKPGLMIHTEKGLNACLEDYKCSKWSRRIIGFYRHKKLC
jgi:hypothetical protein